MVTAFNVPLSPALGFKRPTVGPDAGTGGRRDWQAAYIRRLRVSDTLIVIAAVLLAQWVRFGDREVLAASNSIPDLSYSLISTALIVMWLGTLVVFRTRTIRVIGSGPEEYRRILASTIRLFGLIAIVSLLLRVDLARLYLGIAFPVGLAALIASRWCWRRVIARKRARGEFQTSVLVVGGERAVKSLAESFARGTADGYRVVGVCTPGRGSECGQTIAVAGREIPVLGDERHVLSALSFCGADTVAVTATEHLGHDGMRALAWALEPHHVDLVVAPGMVDVAGPRLSMRPVAGLPLIHVEKPQYHGAQRFMKTGFDFVFATVALLAISPLMLAVAVAIKLTSKGPVFYKSERMGLEGKPFAMLKFRSMVVNADQQLSTLMQANDGAGVLFKMREDPRVTKVGRIMRKFSIDELPQFINVLRREMSVVGPRPPLRREVETYDGTVRRRLLVKPGITGLWQVSGRSDLSWEETVRLDLSYVENWSMTGDVLIIGKTLKAVVASDGAY
ncbi:MULTISPECIES: sugar transferase [Rhodococcus]|uniref:Sugar transferase n=1 Tax=Rhodococcus oxybenzonivorans TaxID=1990687 RepID=A0AAE4V1N1_9NOCA|nr:MULTISPECIES: sugar transferase [Rhodococcus]MDV7243717.1 sugar transferase [Rhodococcus oxybenzonivorans]MDV7267191.1 sugar transferase [Rhodococcus oxybenzonivorans]MDV7275041.1 sugar transferase [Rhodococcus oxybenzonivorans]MDV7335279.1 sugar transferase [Rhodococcus oxybenzonivorans]MDV7345990.1 sugar transferase [Rhodococcus oxybenzonivorans]